MKKRILIIDNDDNIRFIVSHILSEEGYEVLSTSPIQSHQVSLYKADLILLDEWKNIKDGHMLCKDIKAVHEIRHIPVIIFSTAHNIEEIAETCKADGFVRKPFDFDDLTTEVAKCMAA